MNLQMLPREFLTRMEQMLGDEYPAFLDSYNAPCHQALRVNPLKGTLSDFLKKSPFHTSPVVWDRDGLIYGPEDFPGKHPYHEAGVYYIQEPSAMAPAVFLEAKPGEKILDLCAAPGGKSVQIASSMRGQGLLLSNEIHPARAKILSANIERMGIRNCLVTNESPQALAEKFPCYFDRILVDAPCSGEGMFRKNELACEQWSPENVSLCAARQSDILECAASMLKPGGRMVYSTCTFAPEENEGTISRFLSGHPGFHLLACEMQEGMTPGCGAWVLNPAKDIEKTIRIFPHRADGEGHFLAVLEKDGKLEPDADDIAPAKGVPEKMLKDYLEFRDSFLDTGLFGIHTLFGEQLYLLPVHAPSLDGLCVLRPGLHLGSIKKNRFEPAHALALALTPTEARYTKNLTSSAPEIKEFLNGQTLHHEGPKGWYLITVDGYSVGWGKLSSATMKNHYPKGLRINYGKY